MPEAAYRIYPDSKDVLIYTEGPDRTLKLDGTTQEDPMVVSVPTADLWSAKTPAWCQGRRALIVDRLRAAPCLLWEVGHWGRTLRSPEGDSRVEVSWEIDERGAGPLTSIRLVLTEGNVIRVQLDDAELTGGVRFPQPGVVVVPFRVANQKLHLGFNLTDSSFWSHPLGAPQSLDLLPRFLATVLPPPPARSPIKPQPRSPVVTGMQLAGCLLFLAVGIWQGLAGHLPRDRFLGAACAVFFSICGLLALGGIRRT